MSQKGLRCPTETKVQQQFKDETNVSNIVKRFNRTGQLPRGRNDTGQYIDISNVGDYTEMFNRVQKVQKAFMKIPSDIRTRFRNNPQNLIDFLGDENNREEAQELGLIPKPPKETKKTLNELNSGEKKEKKENEGTSSPEGSE